MNFFNTISLLPQSKVLRTIYIIVTGFVAAGLLGALVYKQVLKSDLAKSMIEIERDRVKAIDIQLAGLYKSIYTADSNTNVDSQKRQIELRDQAEALTMERKSVISSLESATSEPNMQAVIFTILSTGITSAVVIFFINTFKSPQTGVDTLKNSKNDLETLKIRKENLRNALDKEIDLLKSIFTPVEISKIAEIQTVLDVGEQLGDNKSEILTILKSHYEKPNVDDKFNIRKLDITETFSTAQDRLQQECDRLNRQALLNLFLCFFVGFFLIGVIVYSGLYNPEVGNHSGMNLFMIKFLPRIVAVASLLTMFLYFSKMYKASIIDVKYYQNELTNIEAKKLALRIALVSQENVSIDQIVVDLLAVDRNGVFSTDKTNVELERLRIENDTAKNYWEKIISAISQIKLNT